jgi:protein TonB
VASSASSASKHASPERRAKPASTHATAWGAAVAISIHALVAFGLMLVPEHGLNDKAALPVEVDVLPPPAAPLPPPPELPPPTAPEPRPVVRKLVAHMKPPPPMPNQEVKPAKATEDPVQPVFGVTQDSVVAGESPVAVPVGNTLMTKDRTLAKAPPPPLPAAPPPPAFVPVDEESVAEFPEAYVKPEPEYPEIARRMGIGGKVLVRIGIDRKGNVKSVRVLDKAGYGMDEAAVKAAWHHRFRPAKRADGEPVDFVITYSFSFLNPGR